MDVGTLRKPAICPNADFEGKLKQNSETEIKITRGTQEHVPRKGKKDCKRPELQIYRPGMGLHNRCVSKLEESLVSHRTNSMSHSPDIIRRSAVEVNYSSKSCDGSQKGKSSKSKCNVYRSAESPKPFTRNRRPDIQVYVPKPKAAAKLEETKKKICHSSVFSKHPINAEPANDDVIASRSFENSSISRKGKNTAIFSEMKHFSNSQNEHKQSFDALGKHSILLDYKVDNQQQGRHTQNCRKNQSETDDSNLPSNLTDGEKVSRFKEKRSVCNKEKENKHVFSKHPEPGIESSKTCTITRKNKNFISSHFEHSLANDDSIMHTAHDNGKIAQKDSYYYNSDLMLNEHSHETNGIVLNGNENGFKVDSLRIDIEHNDTENSRKDCRDSKSGKNKMEHLPPPRFQDKNRNIQKSAVTKQLLNNSSIEKLNGGGILRVPLDSLSPELSCENTNGSLCDETFQEPFVYVHKHLYDPNNPDIPEIVSVPAPIKAPLPVAVNYCIQPNENCQSIVSELCSSPVEYDLGYIPPPRPPIIQYPFHPENNFVSNDVSKNFNTTQTCANILSPTSRHTVNSSAQFSSEKSVGCKESSPYQDNGKKRLKPVVENNLKSIAVLEREFTSCLSDGITNVDMNILGQFRWKLQFRYEKIILADPRYCAEKNIEQCLWKTVFHQIIESLRNSIEKYEDKKKELTQSLLSVVHEGTTFYEHLLEKQEKAFGFKLSELPITESLRANGSPDLNSLVLISCQKSFIFLGDLARYKEQASGTTNYGTARSWYLKAQQIAPKNGRPYNQLAILALHARRKLDAVYFYMRSLAASNPLLSARESLLSLFEGARKKYEQWEKRRLEEKNSNKQPEYIGNRERCELWFKPDGSGTKQTLNLEQNCGVSELPTVELNKRFVASFLHVHGKLFTKVGMETFSETVKQMLTEFHELLQRKPLAMRSSRLLQLLAINMFTVANVSFKESINSSNAFLQEQALQVILATMSLIMERCCSLHKEHIESPESSCQLISDDCAELLPAVKIWTDWMSCQKELWSPPPPFPSTEFRIGYENDIWSSFASLLTTLRKIDTSDFKIMHTKEEGYEPLILEEDVTLAGFVPLLGAVNDTIYLQQPYDKDKVRHCLRISKIQFFGDYLCGIATPYLEYDVEHRKFVSLVNLQCEKEMYIPTNIPWDAVKEDLIADESCDGVVETQSTTNNPEDDEIQQLWSKVEALNKAKVQQEKYKAQVQSALQSIQYRNPTVLRIQPKYLIPDTNCFIDHLQVIKTLLDSLNFTIIVPLIVVNELDGLAHGTREDSRISPQHANKVTTLSREAISFLEFQFSAKNSHLRAVTSKGSILDTISFRSENMSDSKDSNDDRILQCCLHYCKDQPVAHGHKNSDSPIQLFRDVVLLTDDKILRMKALTHNVPARDILAFVTWAAS